MAEETTDFRELIYRGVESEVLDYKAAQSWNAISRVGRAKLVRHMAAFANTKGGCLVIGVGEDASGYPGLYQGVSDAEAASFDPSRVGAFVNRCIEPGIDFTIERPVVDGKRYVLILVKPFTRLPHVCALNIEHELRAGVFYIRTQDASSRPAVRAIELHELIQRALRNQRQQLGRMLRGILYETQEPAADGFESGRNQEEINSAERFFCSRRSVPDGKLLRLTILPVGQRWHQPLNKIRSAIAEAMKKIETPRFLLPREAKSVRQGNIAIRMLAADAPRMWQFDRNGWFVFLTFIDQSAKDPLAQLELQVRECIAFYAEVASQLQLDDQLFKILLSLPGAAAEILRSGADLAVAPEVHARHLIDKLPESLL